ncbi:MAG: hypothetical protein ACF8R7_07035 [Phycisphaerales bacterium JB039]
MPTAAKQSLEHVGETAGMQDHDRDLINDLARRLDCLWRCDQYIANAEGHEELTGFWQSIKRQEQENVDRVRRLIRKEIEQDCF